ncbi:hypothetical protein C8J55DRAFT_517360 [Lentinula edodes]|uniref:Uncharacterized protein n=1 Tax=Lentinula lateritia TaxID=40482 RepID=A0A9W9A844_9AGAR|nr:hypothetical protein C8J55DRAFT_517360 [Lentinula edodes]
MVTSRGFVWAFLCVNEINPKIWNYLHFNLCFFARHMFYFFPLRIPSSMLLSSHLCYVFNLRFGITLASLYLSICRICIA